ncbi:hypothetical protein L1049_021252 [Liquidambar formosana]|uniref:PGG domain-containing protein n=1 Tax=Liquidambar formosana TaxID=63359 RepID=A0AAP0X6S7_LIQFO
MESAKLASSNLLPIQEGSPESSTEGTRDNEYHNYRLLYLAVETGNWEATKEFLDQQPKALTARISSDEDTALHIAARGGHVKIVEELVKLMPAQDLEITNKNSVTALTFAATGGITKIAECLVRKNSNLLSIPNRFGLIPVVVASLNGHKDMIRYLYSVTPLEELRPEKGATRGAMLLTTCIMGEFYDIALDILKDDIRLATALAPERKTTLYILAQKSSAFPSGTQLIFWQRWIYNCIPAKPSRAYSNIRGDIERPHESPTDQENIVRQVPGIKFIYTLKLKHVQAHELLSCICLEISKLDESQLEHIGVFNSAVVAVKHGIVEYIDEIIKAYPDIIWYVDENGQSFFSHVILERQEKIFSLLLHMGAKKNSIAGRLDKSRNNMLHLAAFSAPSSRLDNIPGVALQMQREIQWFKEVENIVQPKFKDMVNFSGKTPRVLFTDEHKKLVKNGEKWMKETAASCMVVGALIATVMFAAAFTIPGGNDQNTGVPIFLFRNSFMVFIVSDALSLFSSCASVLLFLGVLTSRYSEEDFLYSLPSKLIMGLSTLFFSILTMMITFGITLVLVLGERLAWVSIPIMLLASIPATLFAILHFPLFVDFFVSTYGPGIFDRPKEA